MGLWVWPYSPLGWSGRKGILSLEPQAPTILAAGPRYKEMFGPTFGNATGATLKPVAVSLPTGLNTSEEQTSSRAFLSTYLQGEVGLRDVGQVLHVPRSPAPFLFH